MKKILLLLVALLFVVAQASVVQADVVDNFYTQMSGSEEVPPVSTSTTGSVELIADNVHSQITYTLKLTNANHVMAAHLHCGIKGQNGPVVAFLLGKGGNTDVSGNVLSTGNIPSLESTAAQCSTPINSMPDLLNAIKDGKIYANAHSVSHPAGEIRGQLSIKIKTPSIPTLVIPGGNSNPVGQLPGGNPSSPFTPHSFVQDITSKNNQLLQQISQQNQNILHGVFGH